MILLRASAFKCHLVVHCDLMAAFLWKTSHFRHPSRLAHTSASVSPLGFMIHNCLVMVIRSAVSRPPQEMLGLVARLGYGTGLYQAMEFLYRLVSRSAQTPPILLSV
jgi:hypothetical protein